MNKTEFPAPPAGRTWHNPEGYTPEQIEVDKGWRLTLAGEEKGADWQVERNNVAYFELSEECDWAIDKENNFEETYTYRTQNPLPELEIEMSETQKAFEDWAESQNLSLSKEKSGEYVWEHVNLAYQAWTAANPVRKNKPAPTWNRDDNVVTMRIINSTDEENSHYYVVQVNEFGCVQLQMFSFDGGELLESFSASPEDSLLIAESFKFISDEEIKKGAF